MSEYVPFQIVEDSDWDGTLRIALIGELDLAVSGQLSARLEQLSSDGTHVRLDLSRLEFVDSTGMRALVRAARDGYAHGEMLVEIDHDITRNVQRVIDLLGVAPILWPTCGSLG